MADKTQASHGWRAPFPGPAFRTKAPQPLRVGRNRFRLPSPDRELLGRSEFRTDAPTAAHSRWSRHQRRAGAGWTSGRSVLWRGARRRLVLGICRGIGVVSRGCYVEGMDGPGRSSSLRNRLYKGSRGLGLRALRSLTDRKEEGLGGFPFP
jgi:hypothetical protein